ncbi:hypothetical protein ASPWEDRAFT_43354 [Aspergillus wentii DTO 134E9]|uniref:Uncharacterized protein n=1 Tax=Aspergillus wentii DTO 134E9 TaxID=1073089 RepID=A0A1L9REC7_ASPWE|nr:uncharacterized protein ASPWEDRAFT_43354 [Aspergillus wentii DTO 134E9]OJJ33276.1 hypothetical protein ASPWEDRAFT_43354 [Aspergillus wentii DTO 134E9]
MGWNIQSASANLDVDVRNLRLLIMQSVAFAFFSVDLSGLTVILSLRGLLHSAEMSL